MTHGGWHRLFSCISLPLSPFTETRTRVSEYLHLITTLIIAFGLCFQLPVVLTLLARMGMVSSQWLRKQWRYAVVIIFAVAAVLTPPDVLSQTGLAIPTCGTIPKRPTTEAGSRARSF